jgi:hypothetical protein
MLEHHQMESKIYDIERDPFAVTPNEDEHEEGQTYLKTPYGIHMHWDEFNDSEKERMNHHYLAAKRTAEEAWERKHYGKYIDHLERAYRLGRVIELSFIMDPLEWAPLFLDAWIDSEFPNRLHDECVQCLDVYEPQDFRRLCMDENELRFYEKLLDTITIYRGIAIEEADQVDLVRPGLSWTLDRSKARWFAGRWGKACPTIMTAKVNKADILSISLERNEHAVLVLPDFLKEITTVAYPKLRLCWNRDRQGDAAA